MNDLVGARSAIGFHKGVVQRCVKADIKKVSFTAIATRVEKLTVLLKVSGCT